MNKIHDSLKTYKVTKHRYRKQWEHKIIKETNGQWKS